MELRPDSHLQVGDRAPDFEVLDADDRTFRLSEELEKAPIVLAFHPSDFGIICSIQMREFKEVRQVFEEKGYRVVWINTDSRMSHRSWRVKAKIPFPLLEDEENEVSKLYGIFLEEDGLLKDFSNRALFVIQSDGTISYKWVSLRPATSPPMDELLAAL
jgi:peroxiredoxin